jgi:hypothetical protein
MDKFLDELKRIGFAGVQNFPTVGLIDGTFRANLEETGMGFDLEVDMIRMAREKDMLTTPYVFGDRERKGDGQSRRGHHRVPSRADHGRFHRGRDGADAEGLPGAGRCLGRGGAEGQQGRHHPCAWRPGRHARGCRIRSEEHANCHGFYGASSMERLPTEVALTEQTRAFKAIKAR